MKRLSVFALLFWAVGCASRPTLPSFGVVPEFHLIDQTGQPFDSLGQLKDKVWIANFIFTNCPGPCPRMTGQMRQVRDAVQASGKVRFVSFTIDPARDTPQVLAAYSRRFGADSQNWVFLTGSQSELHNISRTVFKLGNVDGTLEHSTRFVLVDSQRRIRGYYDTSDGENILRLIRDIKSV